MKRLILCSAALVFLSVPVLADGEHQARSVAELRRLNPEGTGSVHENEIIRVTGVAITEAQQYAPVSTQCGEDVCPPGTGFYLDDGDGGILVWSYLAANNLAEVTLGTTLTVTGKVNTYRGRLQLTDFPDPACAEVIEPTAECPDESLTAKAPSLAIDSQGAALPEPVPVSLAEIRSAGELLEGRLVQLTGVYPADIRQTIPPPGQSRAFHLRDNSVGVDDNPLPLYIGDTTDVGGNLWPHRSQCDLVAIADEFTAGGAGGGGGQYRQIRARAWADFTNFRPREDSVRPSEVTPIIELRPADSGNSPKEGEWALVEGWLTSSPRTMGASWNSGIGFSLQDDSGGIFVISSTADYLWEPPGEGIECQADGQCAADELCSPLARCQVYRDPGTLALGTKVQVLGRVSTNSGRLVMSDANVDEPLMVTVVMDGENLQRVIQPRVVTVAEFLQEGEALEGVLLRVNGLHLADGNQQLPLGGRAGELKLKDEENQLAVELRIERNACLLDEDGLRLCVNQDGLQLPPENYSGGRDWDEFQFDVVGVGDEYATGSAAGRARLVPRSPEDFVSGSFRNWSASGNNGGGGETRRPPPPPKEAEGCGCSGGLDAAWLAFLAMGLLRRRRT